MNAAVVYALYFYHYAKLMGTSAVAPDAMEQWGDLASIMRAAAYALGYGDTTFPAFKVW